MRPPSAPLPPPATVARPVRPDPVPPPMPPDRAALRRAARLRRRAEAAERRRYARRHRARRAALLAAAVVVVLLAAVPPVLAFTPVFAVRSITTPGASAPVAAALRTALAAQLGRPVATVSDADVAAAVARVPAVARFAVVRLPPSTLEIRVSERQAVLQEQRGGQWAKEDAAGVVLGSAETPFAGLPRLTLPADVTARPAVIAASASAVLAVRKAEGTRLTAVSATSPDDVVLRVQGITVRWGGSEHGAAKAEALVAALRGAASGVTEIDVSSPGLVQTR